MALNRDELAYWEELKAGDYVSLSDFSSLEAGGPGGQNLGIGAIRDIVLRDADDAVGGAGPAGRRGARQARGPDSARVLARYRVHELEGGGRSGPGVPAGAHASGGPRFLVLVSAGSDFELRLYRPAEGWVTGSRDQLVDRGLTWFFLPPPDPEDFISSDLELAPYADIPPPPGAPSDGSLAWAMSGFGRAVYGSFDIDTGPTEGTGREIPVVLAEYEAEGAEIADPLVLYLEENWMRRDGTILPEGGLVSVLVGHRLGPSDIEVFKS